MSNFDEFWEIYPRKTAKKPARKAWEKLSPDYTLLEKIRANIEARIRAGEWREKQYIPHPATYLNQERWEDEVIENAQRNTGQPQQQRRLSAVDEVRSARNRAEAERQGTIVAVMGSDDGSLW